MSAYRLEEIAAEKLRALLQARQHLRDRGWLRSRPRDLYDLWYLQGQNDYPIDWQSVSELLPAKAEAYGVGYIGPKDFLDERVLQGIQRDWQAQLATVVVQLPPYEQPLATVRDLLSKILR